MIICLNCGKSNKEADVLCSLCGSKLIKEEVFDSPLGGKEWEK